MNLDGISEDSGALMCYTDKRDCCREEDSTSQMRLGEWYYPNGSVVRQDSSFYKNRGLSVVHLHRRMNAIMPTGVFHCEVPDSSGVDHSIYVGVYPREQGNNIHKSIGH